MEYLGQVPYQMLQCGLDIVRNPDVTIARSISDTFAGIAPGGVIAFVAAQLAGALVAVALARWLFASLTVLVRSK